MHGQYAERDVVLIEQWQADAGCKTLLQRRLAPRQIKWIAIDVLAYLCRARAYGAPSGVYAALGLGPGQLHGIQITAIRTGMSHDPDGLARVLTRITYRGHPIAALLHDGLADSLQQL